MATRKELQEICKKRKVPGWYKMNKAELEKILNWQDKNSDNVWKKHLEKKLPAKKSSPNPQTSKLKELQKDKEWNRKMIRKYNTQHQGFGHSTNLRRFHENIERIDREIKELKRKSQKRKLKIYLFSASIRSEEIGDVNFIIATNSKKNAAARIDGAGYGRWGPSWIMERISTHTAETFSHIRPYEEHHKNFKPMDEPNVLFMYETDKMEGHIVSWRKKPKFIKKWEK